MNKGITAFIERHEWLGKTSHYPTDVFAAWYRGVLAGVVIMDPPLAQSTMLGDDMPDLERLISRGASAPWAPSNLGSWLISRAISWMVQHTRYRVFTGYADTTAQANGSGNKAELGVIYQAAGFMYLGQTFGAGYLYRVGDRWVSSRYFRSRSVYKKLAKEDAIIWRSRWQDRDKVLFVRIPHDIELRLRQLSREYQASCERKKVPSKHKYCFVAGKDRRETKKWRTIFESLNATYPYPRHEMESKQCMTFTAVNAAEDSDSYETASS